MNLRERQDADPVAQEGRQGLARRDSTHAFWRDLALPFVESRRACHSRVCYRPHHHPTFSIGAVDGGSSVFTGAADGPLPLHPGTLVFVPAGRTHACNPASDMAWSYQMLQIDAGWLQTVRQEYTEAHSMGVEPVRIVNNPATYLRFCRLNALLFSEADLHEKEAALIEFIGESDSEQGLRIETRNVSVSLAAQIQPALDCLRSMPEGSMGLVELARLAGLSRYQLIRAFNAVTGLTPHAWQLNERINLARQRIRNGDDFADLAQYLGFSDQAHFQRVFKAYAGVTPGRFRA